MLTLLKRCQSTKWDTLSLETIRNELDFPKKSYYLMKHQEKKELLLLAIKLTEKISDSLNTEEQYQSFVRKKNAKSAKQSKIITQQPNLKTQTLSI